MCYHTFNCFRPEKVSFRDWCIGSICPKIHTQTTRRQLRRKQALPRSARVQSSFLRRHTRTLLMSSSILSDTSIQIVYLLLVGWVSVATGHDCQCETILTCPSSEEFLGFRAFQIHESCVYIHSVLNSFKLVCVQACARVVCRAQTRYNEMYQCNRLGSHSEQTLYYRSHKYASNDALTCE